MDAVGETHNSLTVVLFQVDFVLLLFALMQKKKTLYAVDTQTFCVGPG